MLAKAGFWGAARPGQGAKAKAMIKGCCYTAFLKNRLQSVLGKVKGRRE